MEAMASASMSISDGDLMGELIYSEQQFDLSIPHVVCSTLLPSYTTKGNLKVRVNFPGWLGKNSTTLKRNRWVQEIHSHLRVRGSVDKTDTSLEFIPQLTKIVSSSLLREVLLSFLSQLTTHLGNPTSYECT